MRIVQTIVYRSGGKRQSPTPAICTKTCTVYYGYIHCKTFKIYKTLRKDKQKAAMNTITPQEFGQKILITE